METTTQSRPALDIDLFTDEALLDPFPLYRLIRDAGPAVYLEQHGVWAMGRYAEVRTALDDWETFSSAQGVSINSVSNRTTKGIIIATDPPEHDRLRNVLADRLAPRAIRSLSARISEQAQELVDRVLAKGSFDAVADLARAFPVSVVLDLVGLPHNVRPKVLAWADAAFNAGGPPGPRTEAAYPLLQDQFAYLASLNPRDLEPGSFGRAIYDAADEGQIDPESCVPLMSAYVTAGLDTTINAISNAIMYFACHPQQWDDIRRDHSLLGSAVNEVLRIESPVLWFSRITTRDVQLEDVVIPEGARVMLLFSSANRDERKWMNPEAFDIHRNPVDHLAFGYGVHGCAGQGLARLEVTAILTALAKSVERFETGHPVRRINSRIRGLESLPTVAVPAR